MDSQQMALNKAGSCIAGHKSTARDKREYTTKLENCKRFSQGNLYNFNILALN